MSNRKIWAEFWQWAGQEKRLTLISAIPSVLGSLVISLALTGAHSLVVADVNLSSALIQPHDIAVQGSTLQFIILGTVLITTSSIVQSALAKVQAFTVLSYLQKLIAETESTSNVHPRNVMVERLAFERWVKMVSNVFQVIGFAVLMVYLEGLTALLGVTLACALATVVGHRWSKVAFATSEKVLSIQQKSRELHRPARKGQEPASEAELIAGSKLLSKAIYERDTKVFRAPVSIISIVSIGSALFALAPPIMSNVQLSFPYLLLAVFLWRQRMIEAVSGVGPLMWNFTNLLDAYDRLDLKEGQSNADLP